MTILIKKSEERIMYENFDTNERLEEVIQWVTNDFWHELSHESKSRVIRQLKYMGYPTEDLEGGV
jgi:SOS response regulatory protein OraA/RecX